MLHKYSALLHIRPFDPRFYVIKLNKFVIHSRMPCRKARVYANFVIFGRIFLFFARIVSPFALLF